MTSEKSSTSSRKEKNQNIQVFVRLRPLNQREKDIKSLGVVEVHNGREVVVRHSQQSMHTKRFTFDRAFPPHSKQIEVYQEVVSPLIEEVLAGYNCTVFAYGQTGTGKTHTMVGEAAPDESTWQTDPLAGIIPRALSQLFDELRISDTEYTVRVSYLELYNEELFDLLSTSEDNSKLRIYEDVTRKGANIVNGLEEITVYNKNEVFKIMAQGQERKRVASTLMNAQSSNQIRTKFKTAYRSHTVFTIVVHMKENSPEGEELVKIGKLNLVDLAGSENISKAGSDNPAKRERARECVNINQSLLTLGRVITALVERHPHIPYRESKLTRILQESLGGRTKTSIIATISPGHKDLEETMSTLEYAHRAKNIQNKPEVNQKMTKKAILKEYAEEIDRLKRDLYATREKNGVYLANETFAEMTLKQEEQRKEIQELLLKKRAMEEERDRMEKVFEELNKQLEEKQHRLIKTVDQLSSVKDKLANTANILNTTKCHFEEQKHLVEKHAETESVLSSQAQELLAAAEAASTDASKLLHSVDRRKSVESTNLEVTRAYREASSQQRNNMFSSIDNFVATFMQGLGHIQTALELYTKNNVEVSSENKKKLENLVQQFLDILDRLSTLKTAAQGDMTILAAQYSAQFRDTLTHETENTEKVLEKFSACVEACLQMATQLDLTTSVTEFLRQWQQGASTKLTSLREKRATLAAHVASATEDASDALRRRQRDACSRLEEDVRLQIASVNEEVQRTKHFLEEQIQEIDREQAEFETAFAKRAEEERRLLEERLQRQFEMEKNCLQERIKRKMSILEEEKKQVEERSNRKVEWLNERLRLYQQEIEMSKEAHVEYERRIDSCLNSFFEKFEIGCTELAANVEHLGEEAVGVVDKVKEDLVARLQQAQTKIQEDRAAFITQTKQSMGQVADDSDRRLQDMLQACNRCVDNIVGECSGISTTTIEDLTSISNGTACLASSCLAHENEQKLALATTHRQIEQSYGALREQGAVLEDLEARFLSQEYAVYNPSGSTPVRTEYRYPRTLASTSPHERILARFRAMRQSSVEEECILVESESEARSDTESSASEDSTIFAAPSPLTITNNRNHNHSASNLNHSTSNLNHSISNLNHNGSNLNHNGSTHTQNGIVKCTSETDIYRGRQQDQRGKENTATNLSRNTSFKKPSKLPAPSSQKKPFCERNTDN